jgi:hypothetical protein
MIIAKQNYMKKFFLKAEKLAFKIVSLLRELKFTKIPKEIWGGDWGELGYIIEIIF